MTDQSATPPPIRITGGTTYLDGKTPMGVKVATRNDEGWLHVDITADESIIGYCVTVNGRSLPLSDAPDQKQEL